MIFVDLDGVLADFDAHYLQLFGTQPPEQDNGDESLKWANIKHKGDFFLHMPLTSFGRRLWGMVSKLDAHILTAVPKSVTIGAAHKMLWCKRELVGAKPHQVILCPNRSHKLLYCTAGDILIEDRLDTLDMWRGLGGIGVHVSAEMEWKEVRGRVMQAMEV